MSAELRDVITTELEAIETEWPNVYNKTKTTVSTMENYYSNSKDTAEVVALKTDADRKELKEDLDKHTDLASRGSNIKRDLKTQVESSENRVQRMIKYGRPTVVAFAILGALIGGDIGGKVPGLGEIILIVVGRLLGLIIFGLIGFFVYFIMEWRFKKRRKMWKDVEDSKQGSIKLVGLINKKKSCLSEIRNLLNDIEGGNMATGRVALLQGMSEYLKQEAIHHDDHDQV